MKWCYQSYRVSLRLFHQAGNTAHGTVISTASPTELDIVTYNFSKNSVRRIITGTVYAGNNCGGKTQYGGIAGGIGAVIAVVDDHHRFPSSGGRVFFGFIKCRH